MKDTHKETTARPYDIEALDPAAFVFKAAIFDFDGTVADSLDVWKRVDELFFAKRGLTYAADYAEKLSILGFEDGARYTIDAYGLSETVEQVCDEWNELGRELYRTEVELRSGSRAYIEALRDSGVLVALATTNAPQVINALKGRYDIDELFPVRVHGCEVEHHTKDHPDIYLEAARRLGVAPEDCVVFEDVPAAILCAKRIGMTTVGVMTSARHQNQRLVRQAADYVIDGWE